MKRFLAVLLFLGCAVSLKAEGPFEAMSRDKTMIVHSTKTIAVLSSTYTILVDISSTTTFPHDETGEIHITRIDVLVDKLAASTGTIKLGVVNNVNITTGSVTFFARNSFERNVSNTNNLLSVNLEDSAIYARANPATPGGANVGTTPFIYSNDNLSESTVFQTDVKLTTPNGHAAPGLGDIILFASNNDATNTYNVIATIHYHTHQR